MRGKESEIQTGRDYEQFPPTPEGDRDHERFHRKATWGLYEGTRERLKEVEAERDRLRVIEAAARDFLIAKGNLEHAEQRYAAMAYGTHSQEAKDAESERFENSRKQSKDAERRLRAALDGGRR